MEIKLLGTAAAEGYPAIFCKCESCNRARTLGGKNIRTRSSAIIDDYLKIDFPPDTLHHVLMNNLDLGRIEHLLFTHTHHDHFHPEDVRMRTPIFAHNISYPLHIYGNDVVMSKSQNVLAGSKDSFQFHHLKPFSTVQIGEYEVTPLLADHNPFETCFIYYIEKGEKALLYGHDTGWFPEETWRWLEGKKLDVVILDCTNGLIPGRRNHMDIDAVKEIQAILTEKKIISKDSQVIATHFSHNINLSHEELEELLQPSGIQVAYDGMVITF